MSTRTRTLTAQQAGLLVAVLLAVFMALLDVNIVTVALPAMQADLHGGVGEMQWVMNAYTLCIAALALSAGALADRYGRKRMFVTGVVLFTAGSAVCALAPNAVVLVIGRFVQGIGAAITVPGTLSLIAQGFPEQGQRARVIGVWSMVAGLAAIAGPVLGGALVDALGWSSIFLVNLPIGLVAVVVAVRSVTESADPDHASLDPAGQVLCVAWLGLLLYGLINAGTAGWSDAGTVLPLAAAVVLLAGFLVVEVRQERPMLPVRLFRHPPFAGANTASFLLGFSVLSALFFLPLYLQQVHGASAAEAGLLLLPMPICSVLFSYLTGRWTGRAGPRLPMITGYLVSSVALAALVLLEPGSSRVLCAVLFALLGIGGGIALTPTNAAVMASVPIQRSGVAAATVNAGRQTGTSLGIALLGTLFASLSTDDLVRSLTAAGITDPPASALARTVMDEHALADAAARTGLGGVRIQEMYGSAFVGGLHVAMLVAAAASLAATAIAIAVKAGRPGNDSAWRVR